MAKEVPRLQGAASRQNFTQGRPRAGDRLRAEPVRFLLSGDFRLGEVCQPMPGLDPIVERKLISVPYSAAAKVVDLAVFEPVDFVILIGQQFSPTRCGVQEPSFLLQQFARLEELSIPVLWARERLPSDLEFPDWISWPANVIELDSAARQDYLFARADGRSAGISCIPRSESRDFSEPTLQIAVVPRLLEQEELPRGGGDADIVVSAGGAWTAADRVDHSIPVEFSRGIGPQGRGFDEYGPHGCWMVTMESHLNIHVDFVPCDVIRWRREVAEVDDDSTWEELLMSCSLQSRRAASSGHAATLIKWQLLGHGPLSRELWNSARMQAFIEDLRRLLSSEDSSEGRVSIADVELVFDPREEARLRSERSAWAAWSSAIEDLENTPSQPSGLDAAFEDASGTVVRGPHFKKLRREALHKLIQRVGDE